MNDFQNAIRQHLEQRTQEDVNDIKSRVEALRDNYIRQMEVKPRPAGAVMLITGKQKAAIMIIEIINEILK